MSASAPDLDARSLLAQADFDAVTATVMDNNLGMDQHTAERIVMDALAFVATAADNPAQPSPRPGSLTKAGTPWCCTHPCTPSSAADSVDSSTTTPNGPTLPGRNRASWSTPRP
jgi:hypothetical protein